MLSKIVCKNIETCFYCVNVFLKQVFFVGVATSKRDIIS